MTIETLKSPTQRNRNGISVIKSKFLSVSSMNTLFAILKVTDPRRDVILVGGLYHRFPWRNLPPPASPLACKLYASCACCVNIKFKVHVYSVFVWILLHSLVAVAVSVCRFSFASVTQQWHDDIYDTRRNWKHLPSLILHSKLFLYEGWLGNQKICKLWIYERNEHGKNWTQNVPFGHLKFRCLLL